MEDMERRNTVEELDDLAENDVESFIPGGRGNHRNKNSGNGEGSFSDRFFHPEKYLDESDISTYLGDESYYNIAFETFKKGKKFKFNWASFIFSPIWFLWRKVYTLGIIVYLLNEIWLFMGLNQISKVIVSLVAVIVSGIIGNNCLFYSIQMRKKKADTLTGEEREKYIKKASGHIYGGVLAAIIFITLGVNLFIIFKLNSF